MEQVHHKLREYHRLDALRSPQALEALNGTAAGAVEGTEPGGRGEEGSTRLRHLRAGTGAANTGDSMMPDRTEPSAGTGHHSAGGANRTHRAVGQAQQHRSLRTERNTQLKQNRR